ncbi:MAG TPA: hypothetical protein QF353_04225 [Gammaproteobacteria bacterium]|nr:hypothetical protein [Gammaproteobacteria bacterium]
MPKRFFEKTKPNITFNDNNVPLQSLYQDHDKLEAHIQFSLQRLNLYSDPKYADVSDIKKMITQEQEKLVSLQKNILVVEEKITQLLKKGEGSDYSL